MGTYDPHHLQPLKGRRILLLRSAEQGKALASRLHELGAEAILLPLLEVCCQPLTSEQRETFLSLGRGDWLALTSPNAARCLLESGDILQRAKRQGCRFATVGVGTANVLLQSDLFVDLVSERAEGPELARAMLQVLHPGERVVFAAGNLATPRFEETLATGGFVAHRINVYTTRPHAESAGRAEHVLETEPIDAIAFTSSSTVRFFIDSLGEKGVRLLHDLTCYNTGKARNETSDRDDVANESSKPGKGSPHDGRGRKVKLVCIGEPTADTLSSYGFVASAVAEKPGIEGLVRALVEALSHPV